MKNKNKNFISLWFMIWMFVGCGGSNLTGVADKVLVPPIAVAGEDISLRTDVNVTLSASKSSDKDGSIIAYAWEENGTILSTGIELKDYSSKIPGKHVITLRILDNDELNASDTINIFVTLENQAPISNAGVDEKMRVGEKITLDGSASSDSDGEIVFYEWKKKDSPEVLSTGVQLKNYTPTTEEIHILQLKVTDNEGLFHIDYVFVSVLNNKIPLANAGNDQSIIAGELITLDGNKSNDLDGDIVLYSWEENNTILSTGVNLIDYSSLILGEHNITLTVTDNDGNSDSDIIVVTVVAKNVAPIANAGDNKNIRVSQSIILEGNSSTDSDGSIASYLWKEGTVILGTGSSLNYSTSVIGAHVVELTVTDNEGLSHTDTTTVTVVDNTSPIANAGNDQSIRIGQSVTLDGISNDIDGSIVSYEWTEGGIVLGTAEDLVNYTFETLGIHTIIYTVRDNDGKVNSDTVIVTVLAANIAPVANAGDNKNIRINEFVILDGSASADSDGSIASYLWKEGATVLGTGSSLNYSTSLIGAHIVELTVTDNEGLIHTDTTTVTVVGNTTPLANAGNDQTIRIGQSVTLDGSGNDTDGSIVTYEWKEGSIVLGTAEDLISHTFTTLGVHTIVYTVTDNDGLTNSDTMIVTVLASNIAPVANAGDNKNIRINEFVILDGSASADSDGSIASYLWKEGTTVLGTGSSLNYRTSLIGAHIVELTVTDNEGLRHTDTTTVTVVGNTTPLANAGSDQSVRIGQGITLHGTGNDADGSIVSYEWKEGSTVLGIFQNLTNYTFSTLGTHTIVYTVTDNNGLTNSDTVIVTVLAANIAPVANAGDNKNIRINEFVILDGSASADSDGSIASYLWKEGTVILGTGSNLNYSTGLIGAHIIELTVTDNEGVVHTDTTTVTVVGNTSPLANAGSDQSVRIGQGITLHGTGNDSDGSIVSYEWKEGSTVLGTSPDLTNYTFNTLGTHTIVYTVTDNDGLTNSDTVIVTVLAGNIAPVANAGDNKNIRINEFVILDGSASADSDGSIASYLWKEGTTVLGTGSSLNYRTSIIGAHIVELTVTDNEGLVHADTTTVIVVGNTSPLANAGSDQSVRIGQGITLHGTGNDADGSIVSYEWKEGSTVLGTSQDLTNYTFSTLGTHTIVYTVTDNDGLTNSDTVIVTVLVANVAPVANAGVNKSVVILQDVILNGSASSDSDGSIIAYEWTEGGTVLGTAVTLTYSSAYLGGHTILLKVRDNEGLENTDTVYVTVIN